MLQSVIGQIGIFMICAQAILQFRPKEVYGKYLRLLFSAMILIQIVQPISGLFFGGNGLELQKNMQQLQRRLDVSMEEAARSAAASEKQLQQMSLRELQERLAQQEASSETADKMEDGEGNAAEEVEIAEKNTAEEVQRIEIAPVEKIGITQEETDE